MSVSSRQLIEAPADDSARRYETLAYIDAYDAVLDCDYAFVAYREVDSSGWRVRIRSSQTAGGEFDPAAMIAQARRSGAQGQPYFTWGYSFDPSPSDLRQIQFRVYVVGGAPSEVEIFVQLRNFDGTAAEAKSVRFAWPKGD